jgi:tetratricopeptide (TPR) repeat protein
MADWGWTELDTAAANLSIHYLKGGWPFQPAVMPNHALENYFPKTRAESLSVRILTEKQFSVVVGHVDMGNYYESTGEYEKAFREFKAAYYTIPHEMEFYEKAVTNLLRLQDYQQAYEVLKLSFRYGSSGLTNKWMGQLLVGQQRHAEALPYLQTAYALLPQDKQVASHLALCLDMQGDTERANELRSTHGITAADNTDATTSQLLYTALIKQGQKLLKEKKYEEALPVLKKAHAIKPDQITFKWIGMVDLAVGNIEEGVAFLEKVVQDNPDDFQSHYNLCNGYIKLGQKAQAEATIAAMEMIRPNFDDPQNIRQRVAAM